MKGINDDTTIVAPASGVGGAISVIRISGKDSIKFVSSVFVPSGSKVNILKEKGYTVHYGDIRDDGEIIDDVLVTIFRAPNSYTGEDSVEISCHSSPYIRQKIMQMIIDCGASPALPGDFTRRAFLNGKLDLSQAEAVADLIASGSEASHRLATKQMRGGYSSEINRLRDQLLHFASLVELELDFGEEDIEFAERSQLRKLVLGVHDMTSGLVSSFKLGNAIRNGIPVAIVGKPNSGKSTLLNALLKEERAIVSDIPGTTRDTIEDTAVIEGVTYRFIDTAGLRETSDIIETLGIRKTYQKIDQASVVFLLVEATDDESVILDSVRAIREQINDPDKRLLLIINKTDLADSKHIERIMASLCPENENRCIFMSALSTEDVSILKDILGKVIEVDKLETMDVVVSNIRHYDALKHTTESLERVLEGLDKGLPEDLVAIDIRQAIHYLGEITGEITTDEILCNIFKNFCIGK